MPAIPNKRNSCLGDEVIAGFLEATLSAEQRKQATEHLSTCHACREHFTELARLETDEAASYQSLAFDKEGETLSSAGGRVSDLVVGSSLGRYILLNKVGEGGMGVVYAAFDPELDRRIAVKVIRSQVAETSEEAQKQLRQEARAMARLTHPNVVRVYDVGRQGELVYIAMEYVDGIDLRRFASKHKGEWRRVLDACLHAGHGLVAAHEAGLVHRDFKPSNVLCANDGRVLVADFGLTRLLRPGPVTGENAETQAAGTPGYMAPEQALGKPSTAKSDQYSYCVTVAECVLGRDSYGDVSTDAKTEKHTSSGGSTGVADRNWPNAPLGPKKLRTILGRGMSEKSSERFSSMQVLLDLLERGANRRRRNRMVLAVIGAVAFLGVGMFVLGLQASSTSPVCSASATPVYEVWNEERRESFTQMLVASPYSGHATHFIKSMTEASEALALGHQSACEATFKNKSQSADLYDRQMLCLRSQVTTLATVTDLVERGGSVERAQSALARLGLPEDCQPTESMLNTEAPPKGLVKRAQMQEVEEVLAAGTLLAKKDKTSEGLVAAERAVSLAQEVGYGPLLAKALLAKARTLITLERFADAKNTSEQARDVAAKSHDTLNLVRVLLLLSEITAEYQDNVSEAKAFNETARSIGLGVTLQPHLATSIHLSAAVVARASEEPDRALEEVRLGLAVLAKATKERASARGLGLEAFLKAMEASAYYDKGSYREAADLFAEIAILNEKRLGPRHSGLASTLINLASLQYKLGELDEAYKSLTEARKNLTGPDASQSVLSRCLNLEGLILMAQERKDDAILVFRHAIEVQIELYGPEHSMVWSTKNNLANLLTDLERWEEAKLLLEEQVVWAAAQGLDTRLVTAKINLASTLSLAASDEDLTRASQLVAEILPLLKPDERRRINVLSILGQTMYGLEKYRESVTAHSAAVSLADEIPETRASLKAYLRVQLAGSLWNLGEKARALKVARSGLAIYETLPGKAMARAELEEWISSHKSDLRGRHR